MPDFAAGERDRVEGFDRSAGCEQRGFSSVDRVGEGRGQDGRKTFTASTLYDADGRVVATAEHVWIAVDPELFGGQRPA